MLDFAKKVLEKLLISAFSSPLSLLFFITQPCARTCSDCLIFFYEKEMDGLQRRFSLMSLSVEKVTFLLCYKSNGYCLVCVHPIQDTLGQLGKHLRSQRCSQLCLEDLLRYLRAILSIPVHPELNQMDARQTLSIA